MPQMSEPVFRNRRITNSFTAFFLLNVSRGETMGCGELRVLLAGALMRLSLGPDTLDALVGHVVLVESRKS